MRQKSSKIFGRHPLRIYPNFCAPLLPVLSLFLFPSIKIWKRKKVTSVELFFVFFFRICEDHAYSVLQIQKPLMKCLNAASLDIRNPKSQHTDCSQHGFMFLEIVVLLQFSLSHKTVSLLLCLRFFCFFKKI